MADLEGELEKVSSGRNFDSGKSAFNDSQCLACHRFGNEGGAVGPELTAASSKYSRRDILDAIINPSKVVSDQYQNHTITKKDDEEYTGRIVDENDERIAIQVNPLSNDRIEIKKSDIAKREPRQAFADARRFSEHFDKRRDFGFARLHRIHGQRRTRRILKNKPRTIMAINNITPTQDRQKQSPENCRSCARRYRRIAAPRAVLGAALIFATGQTPQTSSRRSVCVRFESRRHRRTLVRFDDSVRQRKSHARRRPELRASSAINASLCNKPWPNAARPSSATRFGRNIKGGRSIPNSSTTWGRFRITCTRSQAQAKLVGQEGKPESYYFPPQHNNVGNNFPYTFMGLEPGTTKAQVRKCLENWNKGDNGILDLSRAYRLKPGTGWLIPPVRSARARFALHLRAAMGQRRFRHVSIARRRPRSAVVAARQRHAQEQTSRIWTSSSTNSIGTETSIRISKTIITSNPCPSPTRAKKATSIAGLFTAKSTANNFSPPKN